MSSTRGGSWMPLLGLFVMVAVAALVRIASFGDASLNGDELFSLQVASSGLADGYDIIVKDVVHPPLYYFALWVWLRVVEQSPAVLHGMSFVFSIVSVFLVYTVSRRLSTRPAVAVLATTLIALSYMQAEFSLFTRSYALYSMLALMMTLALLRFIADPGSRVIWGALTASVTVLVMTHYMGWLFVAASAPAILFTRDKRIIVGALAAMILPILVTLGWLSIVIPALLEKQGLGQNLGWIDQPTVFSLAYTMASFIGLAEIPKATTVSLFFAIAVLGVLSWQRLRGLVFLKAGPDDMFEVQTVAIAIVASMAVLPPVMLWVLSRPPVELPVWGVRHVAPSQAAWGITLAVGADALWDRRRWLGGTVALVAVLLQGAWLLQTCVTCPQRTPFEAIAEAIHAGNKGESTAVFAAWWSGIGWPLDYYLPDEYQVQRASGQQKDYPDRFWFAYRPDDREEKALADDLLSSPGWSSISTDYFSSGQGNQKWGVELVLVERR